jgi:hypothetical protein
MMDVVRMETFLRQRCDPRRDEPYLRDDERLVARCLAAGVLAFDRRCTPLAHLVAIHFRGRGVAAACRARRPLPDVACPAGFAAESSRKPTRIVTLRAERVADPGRHACPADLGACQRFAGRVRTDLPMGDRTPDHRSRWAAHLGLSDSAAQPLRPHARLRARHGGRAALQQRASSRVVWSDASLSCTGPAPRAIAASRAPRWRGGNHPPTVADRCSMPEHHTIRQRHGI